MGFKAVYRSLMETFPQIDARLLKAVAIEHSKDADAAANVILTEILPYWSKKSFTSSSIVLNQTASSSLYEDPTPTGLPDRDGDETLELEDSETLNTLIPRRNGSHCSFLERESISGEYATSTDLLCSHNSDTISLNKVLTGSVLSQSNDGQIFGNTESEEVILLGKTQESVSEIGSNKVSTVSPNEFGYADLSRACADAESNFEASLGKGQYPDVLDVSEQTPIVMPTPSVHAIGVDKSSLSTSNDFDGLGTRFDTSGRAISQFLKSYLKNSLKKEDRSLKKEDSVTRLVQASIQEHVPESGSQLEFCSSSQPDADLSLTSKQEKLMTESSDIEDDSIITATEINCEISQEVGSCLDYPLKVEDSVVGLVPSSAQVCTSGTDCQLEIGSSSAAGFGQTNDDLTSKEENSMSESSNNGDNSTINTVVTRSGQICRIDPLEKMIEDAKNNKKNLFRAMESVMNMMKEVEIQEKAAKEAKEAAEKGGLDIFVKMEGLKQMLAHAKETNDMHAGEIYGEKAILATEAKELQNRLLSLSEERDKSLAVLDEMRETLEARLAAAEEMRKAAEEEKFEKEKSVQASLAEQEAIMEKVVDESKLLQQQAEENSKLREFLMDRGHVVDSLQGEIYVICQDVRLLKEKFDERVPLSKSVSSSQTTCILASSGSSMKSMAASLVAERDPTSETPEKMSRTSSIVDVQSPKSRIEGETGDEWRQLSDDGWDLFENETELNDKASLGCTAE